MTIDAAFATTKSWFFDHGLPILIILTLAYLIRQFSLIVIGKLIGKSIGTSDRFENKRDRQLRIDTLKSLLGSIVNVITGITAISLIFSELGVFKYLAPLLGSAVAVSLILGFGIQAFVKDFISGIFIVTENQYRVGDVVSIHPAVGGGEVEGTVIRISLRITVLRDYDGAIHFIPNGNVARVANKTLDYAKVNVEIELPIEADFEKAEAQINSLGLTMHEEDTWAHSLVQAPYFHGVRSFEKDHVIIEVRARTIPAEQWRVASELQKRLAGVLNAADYFAPKKKLKKATTTAD